MPEPIKRTCTECGEESEQLRRRFWFRRWEEALGTGKPLAEIQHLCGRCRRRERRRSLLYLCIVLVAIAGAAIAILSVW